MIVYGQMSLVVIGLNHRSAPVEVREKLAFDQKQLREAAEDVFARVPEIGEKVILSTCNRVEIYAQVENEEDGIAAIKRFLYGYHEIPEGSLEQFFYTYRSERAVEHLFTVAGSLDSMVVGEPQILGQVKEAYQSARRVKATGRILNQLFEKAFSVAKRIRSETAISENAVSIAYAAVDLARKIFGHLDGRVVLLIGAGDTIELAGRHLVSHGVKTILVSNHNYDRAAKLATELGGSAVHYEKFTDELSGADIVISSTAAPHYVIKKETVEKAVRQRAGKPIFFIDIAVPRDIEPLVNDLNNVFLYDVDDLENVVQENRMEREKEARKAREIIKSEVSSFVAWLERLEVEPTIAAIRQKAEYIKQRELEKTLARLNLDKRSEEAVRSMAAAIINRLLHDPTLHLKRQAGPDREEPPEKRSITDMVRDLFNLE
ncbi:MAG: glutamyl-tRNA reductase [bacterium]|nr:MAG: glutamyl-tRNA reductase [bacterium]